MIPLSMIPWRFVGAGAAVLAVIGFLWWLRFSAYQDGFAAGKADSQKFYRPIIEEAERRAHEAQGRIRAMETASKALNSEMEKQHAQFQTALAEREHVAQQRIARILRNPPNCDGDRVPEDGGSPSAPDGSPEKSARDGDAFDRAGRDLATITSGCEDDAQRLAQFQQWYRQQAALME